MFSYPHGYLLGRLDEIIEGYSPPSELYSFWYVNLQVSTVRSSLRSCEGFEDSLDLLRIKFSTAMQRGHHTSRAGEYKYYIEIKKKLKDVMRMNLLVDEMYAVDSRGLPIIRAVRPATTNDSNEAYACASLNYVMFYKGGSNSLSIHTQDVALNRRVASGCKVLKAFSLTLFGSLFTIFLKRWMRRTRINKRLRILETVVFRRYSSRLTKSVFSSWAVIFELAISVRKHRLAAAIAKLRRYSHSRSRQTRTDKLAVSLVLRNFLDRFIERVSQIKYMKKLLTGAVVSRLSTKVRRDPFLS